MGNTLKEREGAAKEAKRLLAGVNRLLENKKGKKQMKRRSLPEIKDKDTAPPPKMKPPRKAVKCNMCGGEMGEKDYLLHCGKCNTFYSTSPAMIVTKDIVFYQDGTWRFRDQEEPSKEKKTALRLALEIMRNEIEALKRDNEALKEENKKLKRTAKV